MGRLLLKVLLGSALSILFLTSSGVGSDRFRPTIIGGRDAPANAYPWMAALYRNTDGASGGINERQFCGGVLIHPYWVLTAAHCVEWISGSSDFIVAFGNGDLPHGVTRQLFSTLVILHPEYVPIKNFGHDFALIRLESPVLDIEPIPLNSNPQLAAALAEARIIGWGITEPLDFEQSGVARLQEADVPIVSNSVVDPIDEFEGFLTEAMIATGKANPLTTAYPGDSGGPLLAPGENGEPWTLLGIASFGDVCDPFNRPYTFYNNLSLELDWIRSVAGRLSFNEYPEFEYIKSAVPNIANLTPTFRTGLDASGIPEIRFQTPPASGHNLTLRMTEDLQNWDTVEFDPLGNNWTVSEDETIVRMARSSDQQAPLFAQGILSSNASAPLGPFPLYPSARINGTLKRHATTGDAVNVFKLSFQNPGDTIALRAWSDRGMGLILGLLECSSGESRIVAENVSDYRYLHSRSQEVATIAKPDCRYYAFVSNQHYEGAYELSYFLNPVEMDLPMETPLSGLLEYSDSSLSPSGHYSDTYNVASGDTSVMVSVTPSFPGVIQLYNTQTSQVVSEVEIYEAGTEDFLAYRHRDRGERLAIRVVNAQPDQLGSYQISASVFSPPSSIRLGQTQHRAFVGTPEDDLLLDNVRITGSLPSLRTYVKLSAYGEISPAFFILNETDQELVESGYDYCDVNAVKSFVPAAGKTYTIVVAGELDYLHGNYTLSLTRNAP